MYLQCVLQSIFYHLGTIDNLLAKFCTMWNVFVVQRQAAVCEKLAERGLIHQLESLLNIVSQYINNIIYMVVHENDSPHPHRQPSRQCSQGGLLQ